MASDPAVNRDVELKDGTQLRRYVDLAKYVDLLRTGTLYLRRADRFIDKFEGALTPSIRRAIDAAYAENPKTESADTFYRRCRLSTFIISLWRGSNAFLAFWQL